MRPLQDDEAANPSAVSRDYKLDLEADVGRPALLNVIGGKVTTYRKLAEAALDKLAPHLPPMGPAWTAAAPLPGGDVGAEGIDEFARGLALRREGFNPAYLSRLVRRYGSLTEIVLGDARSEADLGVDLGAGLTEREVAYLKAREWARTPDDVLWRRTKIGLHLAPAELQSATERLARLL